MSASIPLLSVVIPTRNRRDMAAQALKSALLPLPFSYEVILSDNASSDKTPELEGQFPQARYVRRPETLPMAEHWNACIQEARGKYIKLLCDDDWLIAGALTREVEALESDPSLMICASARNEISEGQEPVMKGPGSGPLFFTSQGIFWKMLIDENFVGPPSSATFRTCGFQGFPSFYTYAADWAAWFHLADRGSILLLREPGVNFRIHSGNLTLLAVENGTDFIEVQALRREALRRLKGIRKWSGMVCYGWIFIYRLARRLTRYGLKGNISGIPEFFSRLRHHHYPALPSPSATFSTK